MRLFFALWPDAPAAAKLEALARVAAAQTGGRPAPPDKIHVTLEFLGEVDPARVAALEPIAAGIREPAFGMRLDRTGSFRRARVAWIGSQAQPPGLLRLHDRLAEALRGEGFALDDRPYSPHVTLARNIRKAMPNLALEPIEWRVAQFTLVRSEPGTGRYTTLAAWRLD